MLLSLIILRFNPRIIHKYHIMKYLLNYKKLPSQNFGSELKYKLFLCRKDIDIYDFYDDSVGLQAVFRFEVKCKTK